MWKMNALKILSLAAAAILLGLAQPARATGTNLVPNPGFEQGAEAWVLDPDYPAFMELDAINPHSGSNDTVLSWASTGSWGASAATDPAFCTAISPGAHPASFWYRDAGSISPPVSV